jgi:hypothetical protein
MMNEQQRQTLKRLLDKARYHSFAEGDAYFRERSLAEVAWDEYHTFAEQFPPELVRQEVRAIDEASK